MRHVWLLLVLGLLAAAGGMALAEPATRPGNAGARDPLTDLPSYGDALKRMVIALLAIIAALVLVARFLPRLLARRPAEASGNMIQVLESRVLSPGKTIYLVSIAGQHYLLGASADRLVLLTAVPAPPATPTIAPPPPAPSFADVMRNKA